MSCPILFYPTLAFILLFFSVRRAAARASKRVKVESSDSDNESGGSDVEFHLSGGSDASESASEASDMSSDFNPFHSDSDSDAGMTE